jgi:hypothetical protein
VGNDKQRRSIADSCQIGLKTRVSSLKPQIVTRNGMVFPGQAFDSIGRPIAQTHWFEAGSEDAAIKKPSTTQGSSRALSRFDSS